MSEDTVRAAIGAALDHPFAEEAFVLVDQIEVMIGDSDPDGDPYDIATEITDQLVANRSTRSAANLWAILGANDAAVEEYGDAQGSTMHRIRVDLFVVIERAVFAGLEASFEQEV